MLKPRNQREPILVRMPLGLKKQIVAAAVDSGVPINEWMIRAIVRSLGERDVRKSDVRP